MDSLSQSRRDKVQMYINDDAPEASGVNRVEQPSRPWTEVCITVGGEVVRRVLIPSGGSVFPERPQPVPRIDHEDN